MLVAPDGAVERANDAAVALFPRARPGVPLAEAVPPWLAEAHHERVTDPAGGPVGERVFEARPDRHDDGRVVWWLLDDTVHRRAEEELRTERARTAFLTEASNQLLSSLNLDRCMDVTVSLAAAHLADAALVIAPSSGRTLRVARCTRGGASSLSWETVDPDELPGLAEALQGFPPVPSRWLDPALVPAWVAPAGSPPLGSVVITPLPGHGIPAGALILLRHGGSEPFSGPEEVFARLFAARAGAAMSAARTYAEQASITETLMRELLPPPLRQIAGVEYAGGYRASHDTERVGGDFYDVHPAIEEGGPTLAVLGDVCGKGLNAAVLTGKIRNTLQALLPMADDHQRMISLLNSALLNSHHARFATLVLASAVRESSSVKLRLTSAGHAAPLIVRTDGRVEEAPTHGTLVGALPQAQAHTASVTLAPGDSCVMFTDGITEARGGPLGDGIFGEERLRAALADCAGMPAQAVVDHVQMLASQWVGAGRHDDMAVVVVSAPRTHHLSAVNGHTRGRYTA
ncbi:PP2C family protein-serine/threonine phosphatase [uncultured Streptomyces sp.]|uniref:PP2C family protein-serine/threonine phosphatase n=1 Tax=uncultured Streptomyces sp. TaxID=174707 RepID=UPI002607E8C4|nr:PP2C family protein-serine/threonine phosphatase [uncultured Streptomyces sp.]